MNQSTDKLIPAIQQEGWRPESQPTENAASLEQLGGAVLGQYPCFSRSR